MEFRSIHSDKSRSTSDDHDSVELRPANTAKKRSILDPLAADSLSNGQSFLPPIEIKITDEWNTGELTQSKLVSYKLLDDKMQKDYGCFLCLNWFLLV